MLLSRFTEHHLVWCRTVHNTVSIINSKGLAGSRNGFLAPAPALTSHSDAFTIRVTEDSPVSVVPLALLDPLVPVDPPDLLEMKALRLACSLDVFQSFHWV